MSGMSGVGVANCQLVQKMDKDKITVGDHLQLSCSSDHSAGFAFEKSAFKLEESQKYTIKVLKAAPVSQSEFTLDFTLYAPGEYKLSDLILTDGTSEISFKSLETVKVESVLKPSPDGKPPEPFGSLLPIGIGTPLFYYLFLASIILVFAFLAAVKIKRLSYYKQLKKKIKQYDSPIAADTQFYKAIRLAEKVNYPLDQIEKSFRLYNLRVFQLPMFDLSNERILRYFKSNFPQYKTARLSLARLLDELEELHKKNKELTIAEKQQFIKKLYHYVEAHAGLES